MNKILLVDDEETLLQLYQITFTHEGFIVETATDGKQGIEKAKTFQPDVILLDIMMPNMNGLEALKLLKADEQTKHIPVIMATNLSDPEEQKKTLEAGAADYILKSNYEPISLAVLVKKTLDSSSTPNPQGFSQ